MKLEETNVNDIPVRFVIFNGPKGSGKDFAANILSQVPATYHIKFSGILKLVIGCAAEVTQKLINEEKDTIFFDGVSLRDHQINLYNYLAGRFGDDVLGRILCQNVRDNLKDDIRAAYGALPLYAVSDGGRGPEVEYVANTFGRDNMIIIRLHREGCTFDDDIRSYLDIPGIKTVDIVNRGDDSFQKALREVLFPWSIEWSETHHEELVAKFGGVRQADGPEEFIKAVIESALKND